MKEKIHYLKKQKERTNKSRQETQEKLTSLKSRLNLLYRKREVLRDKVRARDNHLKSLDSIEREVEVSVIRIIETGKKLQKNLKIKLNLPI